MGEPFGKSDAALSQRVGDPIDHLALLVDEIVKELQVELPIPAHSRQPVPRVEIGNRQQVVKTWRAGRGAH